MPSCKKTLDRQPTDFISPEDFFSRKENLNAALAGVYATLKNNALYGDNYQHVITTTTDELVYTAAGTTPKIAYYNATPADAEAASMWSTLYTGIDRANLVLENLESPEGLNETDKRHIKGEATFLRAYFYFMLTQWYGDVPLRIKSTALPTDTNFPFTSAKNVYDWIISEMTISEELLADQKITSFTYRERVTQSAVQGILARVCLYAAGAPVNDTKRYAEASKWARAVINSSFHKLDPDYTNVFKLLLKDQYDAVSRESIWEVGFNVNSAAPEQSSPGQVRVGIPTTADAAGNNEGRLFVYPRLYRTYESFNYTNATNAPQETTPDQRRDWSVAPFKYSGTAPTKTLIPFDQYYTRYPGKFRREEENAPRIATQSPTNMPIIRYADVLLMLAEAENEINGPTAEAINAVNQVRARAYGELSGKKIITSISVTNGGANYITIPTVTITGAGGIGATAEATISDGRVTAIKITSPGNLYPQNSTITITAGGGTGATATLTYNGNGALGGSSTIDKQAFRKAIQNERLMELNGEFLRRQDLKRWGILEQTILQMATEIASGSEDLKPDNTNVVPRAVLPFAPSGVTLTHYTTPAGAISANDIYLPIPQREILYNTQAKQNPGY